MHAVTSVLQESFPKLEQKFLQKVRQDLLFVVGKRARRGRERERERERGECAGDTEARQRETSFQRAL